MFHQPDWAADDAFDEEAGSERLRKRTRLALGLVALLVIGFFGLAAILQVGGAVTGSGEVTVESSVKTVSHPSGGVLIALKVRDGDHVAKDQELMRFDTAVSGVGSASAATGLFQLIARRARLEAERDGAASLVFPREITASTDPEARESIARETRTFNLRREDSRGALALLGARATQYQDQIGSYQAQITAIDRQAALIGPELAGLRTLYKRQLVTLERINALERTAVQLEGAKAALLANIAEARARIAETREQMLNVDKTRRSDAATELATVTAQLNDQQVRVATAGDAYSRSIIRAPQSGTVDKLAYSTVGSAVPAGQPILQIVPDRDALIVEARIRPADVDQLHLGQKARVTFSGLDRQSTPDIAGTLTFISADLAHDERSGASWYRVRILLDPDEMAHAPGIVLKAGMPAQVFVKTGDRSILSFILKPLFDQLRYAMREGG